MLLAFAVGCAATERRKTAREDKDFRPLSSKCRLINLSMGSGPTIGRSLLVGILYPHLYSHGRGVPKTLMAPSQQRQITGLA